MDTTFKAREKDVRQAIEFLCGDEDEFTHQTGFRLHAHLLQNRLQLREDYFWNSPLDGWEMPTALKSDLSQSDLVVSKGDANYRRLLGDRHWSFTTPFESILSYFPAPLVALRTLKSELVSGLEFGQADRVFEQDPDWMINGRWGLVQFYEGMQS